MAAPTFIYDDACPMCAGYTRLFTAFKWSKRRGFSTVDPGSIPGLDLDRGRHEIPLYDEATGRVYYGLNAMTRVLATAFPFAAGLLRHPWLLAALKPLYWLITYNRRVIAGTKPPAVGFDCAPDRHVGWRIAYILLALGLAGLVGFPPLVLLLGLGCTILAGLLLSKDGLEVVGHLATVLLMVSILLSLVPGWVGLALAYGVAGWEVCRRL